MSLVISSTTDDQAAVNAAAGITEEAPETTQQPPEAARPPKPQEPIEVPDEEEEGDEEGEQETEEGEPQPAKKKLGGWQRTITKLRQENDSKDRRLAQLAEELDTLRPQRQPQPPPGPPPEPKLEDYPDNYDAYIKDHTRWQVRQELEEERKQNLQKAREWQQEEAKRAVAQTWSKRVHEFSATVKDFDGTLETIDEFNLHPAIQQSLLTYEHGPRLAYELVRNRTQLEKIAALQNPLDALRELGRFEASLTGPTPRIETRKPFTAPPEPIRPVGKGSNGNARIPLDQLPLRDYIRARNQQEKAAKAR